MPVGTDAFNTFEDLSGVSEKPTTTESLNPYNKLIGACKNAEEMQKAYETHRTNRNKQQAEKMLSKDFTGVIVDKTLQELEYARGNKGIIQLAGKPVQDLQEVDPRVCLVLWIRPTQQIKDLVKTIQERLIDLAPDFWCMPRDKLHLTALELSHSKPYGEINNSISLLRPHLPSILSLQTKPQHRNVLVKPRLSFDAAALAISFVPAGDCEYSCQHLRRDLHNLVAASGMEINSRYALPSAHITVGRFITGRNHYPAEGGVSMEKWIGRIGEINDWLENVEVRWTVGEEAGMVCRAGRLWYGDGETVMVGEAF
ncbi:hypothetical protein L873DRAFT_896606 [Choiromyces venosus 120613-1]|uniref:Uncharacterized protein n=1 Tax=Choiromyces venosus 120613-1 TaxID=1336337 RepID=A0A3N4JN67_9PEZI|nr:hypothetical protein L873DRAFT_896606 [Choiromyces venosus 120613-1]